ncbi:hypothetical protein GCM10009745_79250 [Kribbella yunnanensis]|uniref:Uncharacterized protein n=1 Tax=Kribbella yunnanensis TaxID=190194 RepID=A0ABN2J5R9_9ACTN
MMNRRTERRRLNRDALQLAVFEVEDAVGELLRLPVWPATAGEPNVLLTDLERPARRVAFYADEKVGDSLREVVHAADELARMTVEIRETTSPGRADAVDLRMRPAVAEARAALAEALDRLVVQVRRSLEIAGRYRSLRAESEPIIPPRG